MAVALLVLAAVPATAAAGCGPLPVGPAPAGPLEAGPAPAAPGRAPGQRGNDGVHQVLTDHRSSVDSRRACTGSPARSAVERRPGSAATVSEPPAEVSDGGSVSVRPSRADRNSGAALCAARTAAVELSVCSSGSNDGRSGRRPCRDRRR